MNKILLGLILGTVLGAVDGVFAYIYPEVRFEIVGIIIGSTGKGLIAGLLIGLFSRKVKSRPLGILCGRVVGISLAVSVAGMPDPAGKLYAQVCIPGSWVGLFVGFATQKYGALPQPKQA